MTLLPAAVRALATAGLLLVLAACAGRGAWPAYPSPESLPPGSPLRSRTLDRGDAWLRHYLMAGRADSAVLLLDAPDTRPGDELQRALQRGLVLHRAARFAESNAAFEYAEGEADRRLARSISQAAGSLLVSDRVMSYVPARPEMAMVPLYRMLNYLALGDRDGALVEARKANAWLERLRDGSGEPCVGEGMVLYLTGLVQRDGGEHSAALVSFRQAERAYDACLQRDAAAAPPQLGIDLYLAARAAGVGEVADSARSRYRIGALPAAPGAGTGEVVVLLEHGWVAHRAGQDIHVPIPESEIEELESGDNGAMLAAAGRITAHLTGNLLEQAWWGEAADEHPAFQVSDALAGAYILRMAWPALRLEACAPTRVRVVVAGADAVGAEPLSEEAVPVGDVSGGIARSFAAARPQIFTRMVGRGIAKYLATRELSQKAEKEGGEAAGWLTTRLANAAGNALERADTRSWSLLPDRVSVARFALPAGRHTLRVEVLGPDGEVRETRELGEVEVPSGATVFRSGQVWGSEMGELRRPGAATTRSAAVAP